MAPVLSQRYRWPLAVAVALAAYALAGFLLAPWLLGRAIVAQARTVLGCEASVAAVEVNPFALSLRVRDFRLRGSDGVLLAGLDELRVNLESESLLRRAWTFSEFAVSGPYLNLVRDRDGAINLLKLLAPAAPAPPGAAAAPPRLIVRRLRIDRGVIDVTDAVPASPFHTRVGPLSVALKEFSTLPEVVGEEDVAITLESGTELRLAGDLAVNPLRASGRVSLRGPFLGWASRYVKDQLRFSVAGGNTDLTARFSLAARPGGRVEAALDDLALAVTDVRLTAPSAPDFLGWSRLQVSGGALRWPDTAVSAQSVLLDGLKLKARRARGGEIDLLQLLQPEGAPAGGAGAAAGAGGADSASAAGGAARASVRVGELAVRGLAADVIDESPSSPAHWSLAGLDLTLRDASNEPGARMPVQAALALGGGGKLALEGSLVALPEVRLDADVRAEGLALAQAQPYLSGLARVEVRGGTLALDGHLAVNPTESLAFDGDVRVLGLDAQDAVRQEPLLAWRELALDDVELRLSASSARVARVRLVRPFARLFVNRDQSTNVGALLVPDPGPAAAPAHTGRAAPAAAAAPPWRVRIGRVTVSGGEADFADLSLPLPFAARVEDLRGEFTTLDTRSNAPSKIALEGRVDPYGLARVDGQVRVSAPADLADLRVVFRNIEMPPLSPYTVKFAGRKIARGKIDLDLRYRLEDRRLVGANRIVIDELELGDKVPNPEAVDLPLGLAVALLKDADGRIDLDMPVEGSLDDPQFRIGGVLWKAFVNLLTRVVSAPFRLLGALLGVESEDLGRIDFAPGRADLLPPGREKLTRIAAALGRRPGLAVEVPAVVAAEADAAELRKARVEQRIAAALAAAGAPASGRQLEKRTREVVESLYGEHFPDRPLADIVARHTAPPPEDPRGRPRLDELAYLDELRAGLAAAEPVPDADLAALGAARAAALSAELTGSLQVAPERVRVGARRDVPVRDGQWVPVEIGLVPAGD